LLDARRIRIQEAPKNMDHTDPDPEELIISNLNLIQKHKENGMLVKMFRFCN
jgi:hypothetical protein